MRGKWRIAALAALTSTFLPIPSVFGKSVPQTSIAGFRVIGKTTPAMLKYFRIETNYMMKQSNWNGLNLSKSEFGSAAKMLTEMKFVRTKNGIIMHDDGIVLLIRPQSILWDSSGKTKGTAWTFSVRNIGPKPSLSLIQQICGQTSVYRALQTIPLGLALVIPYGNLYIKMTHSLPRALNRIPPYMGTVEVDFFNSKGNFVSDSNPYLMNQQTWTYNGRSIGTSSPNAQVLEQWFKQAINA